MFFAKRKDKERGIALKVWEIAQKIEEHIPPSWSESWDNVGLLVGDPEANVSRIGVTLNPFSECFQNALEHGCQLLVTHHPVFFRPIQRLLLSNDETVSVRIALSSGISLYAAHTNWDVAPFGVNFILAKHLALDSVNPLRTGVDGSWGLGAYGELGTSLPVSEALERVCRSWELSGMHFYGDLNKTVRRIAFCGGAGGDLAENALKCNADLFITADMNYHSISTSCRKGLSIAIADHYEMERLSLVDLAKCISGWTGLEAFVLAEPKSFGRYVSAVS